MPYRISDLVALIDERMGKLENRSIWTKYHRLIARIETLGHDSRYTFMFNNLFVEDLMVQVLGDLFRLPVDGKPITVMQLAGFPAEVLDSVVSVMCRMAFEFGVWSDGAAPLLVACEEAHRYAPADKKLGFGPTLKALSRIAKEGRKYGVFLGAITQRPADLDSTILSQCSTVFAMRLANDRDQDDHPLGGARRRLEPRRISAVARQSRGHRLRRRRAAADAFPLYGPRRRSPAAQPVGPPGAPRFRSGHRCRLHQRRRRSLARGDDHQSAAAHERSWAWMPTAFRSTSTMALARR